MARESYMKRIGNINPTLMIIHNNQLKILHVHTKGVCTEKSGNINPNFINTRTNQLRILSVHITGLLFLSLSLSLSLWLYFLWHISCWFISSCLCPCCGNLIAKASYTAGSDTINPTLLNKPKNKIKIVYVHVTGVLSAWLPLLGYIICWIISTCYWWVCGTYHRCVDIAEWIPLTVYHQCTFN